MAGKLRDQLGLGDPSCDAEWAEFKNYIHKLLVGRVNLTAPISFRVHQEQITLIADQVGATCPTVFSSANIPVSTRQTRRTLLEHFIVSVANEFRQRYYSVQNPNTLSEKPRPAPYPVAKKPVVPHNHVGPIRVQHHQANPNPTRNPTAAAGTIDPRRIVAQRAVKTETPVRAPVQTPIQAPIQAQVRAPTQAPIQAPVRAPVQAPVQKPTQAPVRAPVQVPTQAPTQVPVQAPVQAPIQTPTQASVQAPVQASFQAPTDFESPLSHTLTYPTPRPLPADNELHHPPSVSSPVAPPIPASEPSDEEEAPSDHPDSPMLPPPMEVSDVVSQPTPIHIPQDPQPSVAPVVSPKAKPRQASVILITAQETEPRRIKSESVVQDEVHNFLMSRNPPLSRLYPYLVAYGCTDMIHLKVMSRWPDDEIRVVVGKMMAVECEDASPTKPMDWDMFRHFLRELKASA